MENGWIVCMSSRDTGCTYVCGDDGGGGGGGDEDELLGRLGSALVHKDSGEGLVGFGGGGGGFGTYQYSFFYFSYCYNYLSSILRVDDW